MLKQNYTLSIHIHENVQIAITVIRMLISITVIQLNDQTSASLTDAAVLSVKPSLLLGNMVGGVDGRCSSIALVL